jgi:hypothetical protein
MLRDELQQVKTLVRHATSALQTTAAVTTESQTDASADAAERIPTDGSSKPGSQNQHSSITSMPAAKKTSSNTAPAAAVKTAEEPVNAEQEPVTMTPEDELPLTQARPKDEESSIEDFTMEKVMRKRKADSAELQTNTEAQLAQIHEVLNDALLMVPDDHPVVLVQVHGVTLRDARNLLPELKKRGFSVEIDSDPSDYCNTSFEFTLVQAPAVADAADAADPPVAAAASTDK